MRREAFPNATAATLEFFIFFFYFWFIFSQSSKMEFLNCKLAFSFFFFFVSYFCVVSIKALNLRWFFFLSEWILCCLGLCFDLDVEIYLGCCSLMDYIKL